MPGDFKQILLKRVVRAVGEKQIGMYLNVSPAYVKGWLAGAAPIPDQTFLHLVDVLSAALKDQPGKQPVA
jgi:hypothetical protein